MSEEKTYQPKWEKHKEYQKTKHHHHHRSYSSSSDSSKYTNTWGGALKMRDKWAYYGLMVILAGGVLFGAYKVWNYVAEEIRSMPMDDPATERDVDELRINKVDEQNALQLGDSLAQMYQMDSSMVRHVQIETRPVYRPPRKESKWYITQREWRAIWRNFKVWRWEKRREKEEQEQQQQQQEQQQQEQ